jgi:hypothetical protein
VFEFELAVLLGCCWAEAAGWLLLLAVAVGRIQPQEVQPNRVIVCWGVHHILSLLARLEILVSVAIPCEAGKKSFF